MKCPTCRSPSNKILEKRSTDDATRRRRECQCGFRWSTWETTFRPDRLVALVRQAAELTAFVAMAETESAPQLDARPPVPVAPPPAPVAHTVTSKNGVTLARVSIMEAQP